MSKCKETFTNKIVKMTKRNELTIKKIRDNEIHFRFTTRNLLCFKQCCVVPKAFLSSSSDAIWIQNKTKSEHKKHWKKQQKDYQNRTKYLQDGRFSIPIGYNKCPKLHARNANRTILKNQYILCLLISTKKNQNNQNLKIEQTLLLKWQSARKHLQIKP